MTGLSLAELGLELDWAGVEADAVAGDGGAAVGNEAWAGYRGTAWAAAGLGLGLWLGLWFGWVGVRAAAELR
jgi:hypothetical protein